jgi:hypothetical protein
VRRDKTYYDASGPATCGRDYYYVHDLECLDPQAGYLVQTRTTASGTGMPAGASACQWTELVRETVTGVVACVLWQLLPMGAIGRFKQSELELPTLKFKFVGSSSRLQQVVVPGTQHWHPGRQLTEV